jgi:hypothetical protein
MKKLLLTFAEYIALTTLIKFFEVINLDATIFTFIFNILTS